MQRSAVWKQQRGGLDCTDRGLHSLASHGTSPRKHRCHFVCVCVIVCVSWPIQKKTSLKLMAAMKWDADGIDFCFVLLLTRQ